jgi:tetratricopeptide (TPR) repeat protein
MGQHEDGLAWARHAEAAIKRIGVGGFMEARLHHDIGVIHDATGDLAQAEAELTKALELYEAVPAADLSIIDAKRSLGDVRVHQGNLDDAAALFREAREATVALLGETHPEVALADAGLARVADARGNHDAAVSQFKAAIAKAKAGYGAGDLDLVPLIEQLASSHARRAEYDKAVEHKKEAYTLLVDALGDHPKVASALYDIGSTLEAGGKHEEARRHHERALKMWEQTRGKDHPDLAYALTSLGLLDVEDGDAQRAVERLERALKLRGGRGLDPQLLAQTQFALARALHATGGDHPRARELATKARDTFAKGKSPDPKRAEEIDRWLQETAKDREKAREDREKQKKSKSG